MAAPKQYTIELGGRTRTLKYTREERREIEARFDCDLRSFVYEKCFPMKDGKPTMGGRLDCQEALIWYGVRHAGPRVTQESISKDLEKLVEGGGSIYAPLSTCIVALLASGVMGWTPPVETEEEGEDEGKEDAAPAAPAEPISE